MTPDLHHPVRSGTWRSALWISGVVVLLFVVLWALLPVAPVSKQSRGRTEAFISMQRPGDSADTARDQALLLDSAPLFLPTRWSTATPGLHMNSSAEMDLFKSFGAEITISSSILRPQSPQVSSSSGADNIPADCGLSRLFGRQGDPGLHGVSPRSAYYEVMDSDGSRVVKEGALTDALDMPDGTLWHPVEFWVRVVQEGLVGTPLLSSGSGVESLDTQLRTLVLSSASLSLLPPGYYRVLVGP